MCARSVQPGRLKPTESSGCGNPNDMAGAALARLPSDGQSRRALVARRERVTAQTIGEV